MSCDVTYEDLSRFESGELDADRAREIQAHAEDCVTCRRRLAALGSLDEALSGWPRHEPSAGAVLQAHRALSAEVRGRREPELMTLDEVAEFLRITLDELEEIVLELPCFELAGQLRVRRSRLIEWVESRERAWSASSARSEVATILSDTF